jgi:hypothetical protein
MKLAIMQPYFLPYIGYWQLINAVDKFVIYDNIQYTKSGWIRRNRILLNGKDFMISLPVKKDSDFLDIKDRYLSDNFLNEKNKIKNQITAAYRKAPYFKLVMPIIERILDNEEKNLFLYLYNSILLVKEYLNINTELIISSSINMNHTLKSQDRVLEICKQLKADHYINPIGGTKLYDKEEFKKHGIKLSFLKTDDIIYKQFDNEFIPNLSIIDVMMFNSREEIKNMLEKFTLI